MTRYFVPATAALLFIIVMLFVSGHPFCRDSGGKMTVCYTGDLQGTLEPCG